MGTTKATQTTLVPKGSEAFVKLMDAVSGHVPVGTALMIINGALGRYGATPESFQLRELPEVLELMMPELRRLCRAVQVDEIRLDLSSLVSLRPPAR